MKSFGRPRLTSVALSVGALAEQDAPFVAGETAEAFLFVVSGQFLYQCPGR